MVKKRVHATDCDMRDDCYGCKPELERLEPLLALCRRYGVTRFKSQQLEFDLAPMLANDPSLVAPSSRPVEAAQPQEGAKREQKRGADGLTAEMQEELLGRVMDAEG